MHAQVLYRYVLGEPEEGFRGPHNSVSSLLAAHPNGFPEDIKAFIDAQVPGPACCLAWKALKPEAHALVT